MGKLKEKYWVEAEKEYLKRLGAFVKIKIVQIKEEAFNERSSIEIIRSKEAEKILSQISSDDFLIVLDSQGSMLSSESFSQKVFVSFENQPSYKQISFIIGGPLGLDKKVLAKANLILSLSKLTFTHQMARVFLWEQIYRASMIKENRKYHY